MLYPASSPGNATRAPCSPESTGADNPAQTGIWAVPGALEVLFGDLLMAGLGRAPGPRILEARCQGLRVHHAPGPRQVPMAMS